MVTTKDSKLVELPIALCDLIARHRLHPRQALHEVVEEAFFFWQERGGWRGLAGPWDGHLESTSPSVPAGVAGR